MTLMLRASADCVLLPADKMIKIDVASYETSTAAPLSSSQLKC